MDRALRLILRLGLLASLAAFAAPAVAQVSTTAYTGQSCAGTRAGATLNCTSNDFTTSASFTQPPPGVPSCTAGSTISLDVILNVASHAPNRYDGALFTGEQGNDPSVYDPTRTCSIGVFPTAPPPFADFDGDSCGDYVSNATTDLVIRNITVACTAAPGTNVLGVPYVLVFDNQASPGCTAATVTASSKAKCIASVAAQVTGVTVQGYLKITEQTTPGGQAQPFAFTASGTAPATPASFALSAGGSQTVLVPLSPTGGTQTLQIDQASVPGWVSGATIICTSPSGGAAPYVTVDGANRRITAALTATNFGASCTIVNEKLATVTLVEQSAGATGPFTFTGGTNGLPASVTLDTGAVNPASSSPYPVAANGVAAAIGETVPAGWTLTGASCTDGTTTFGSLAGSTLTIPAGNVSPGNGISCTFVTTRNPTLTKAFGPAAVPVGTPSTLTFTVTNATGSPAQGAFAFTDTFPAGLVVASPLAAGTSCGGVLYRGGTTTPLAAGDTALAFTGGALAAGTPSCTVSVAVTSAAVGTYTNGAAQASGLTGLLSGITDQTLTTYALPSLLFVKSASAPSVRPGDVVTYTLVVQNTGAGVATAVVLTDPISPLMYWAVDAYGPGVPFQFTDGIPASGVTPGVPVYSADGGATWTLVPSSGGGGAPSGFDGRVTAWKLPVVGSMAPGGQFTLTFKAAVR